MLLECQHVHILTGEQQAEHHAGRSPTMQQVVPLALISDGLRSERPIEAGSRNDSYLANIGEYPTCMQFREQGMSA